MAVLFVDTSAIVKRYINESGSKWIIRLCDATADNLIYIAELTAVEIVSALVRRLNDGSLTINEVDTALSEFDRHLLTDYFVLEINSGLLEGARDLVRSYGLRAYDAVQLAVATSLNKRQIEINLPVVTFVSADKELLKAAELQGLSAENPNSYS